MQRRQTRRRARRQAQRQAPRSPYQQLRKARALTPSGGQRNVGPRYGPGRRGPQRIVTYGTGEVDVISQRKYRQQRASQRLRAREEARRGKPARAKVREDRFKPVQVAGLDVGKAVSKLAAPGTPLAAFGPQSKGTNIARGVTSMPFHVAKATIESPEKVIPATLKTAQETVVNIPSSAVQTVKHPQQAAEQALKDVKRRYGPAVAGRPEQVQQRIKREGAFAEVAEIAGVGAGASRLVARAVKTTKRGRRYMDRSPAREAAGTSIRVGQRRRKGIVGQSLHRSRRRKQRREAEKLYRRADAEAQNKRPEKAAELREKALKKDPRRASEKQIRQRYDQREDLAERRRRVHRGQTLKKSKQALDKKHADVQLLLAQKIIKPNRESLQRYHDDLEKESQGDMTDAQRVASERTRKQLRQALDAEAKGKLDLDDLNTKADDYSRVVRPLQDELGERRIFAPDQIHMARLIPYAVREMDAKWRAPEQVTRAIKEGPPPGTGWRKTSQRGGNAIYTRTGRIERHGRALKPREVEAHMRQNGVDPDTVAFVSQAPRAKGAKAYYGAWQSYGARGIAAQTRTGEATRKGMFDLDQEAGMANAAAMQTARDMHNEYAGMLGEFGLREGGKQKIKTFKNGQEAQAYLDNLALQSPEAGGKLTAAAHTWRPVPLRPLFGKREQSDALLGQANDTMATQASRGMAEGVADALNGTGQGRYALVLDDAADQMTKHMKLLAPTGASRAIHQASRLFRETVLTTTITWPAGNIVEGLLRAGVAGVTPSDVRFAKHVHKKLAELDPEMAEEFKIKVGQGNFGVEDMRAIRMTADKFSDNRMLSQIARTLAATRRAPGPKQMADIWGLYTKANFGINGWAEHWVKMGIAGRGLREMNPKLRFFAKVSDNRLKNFSKAVEEGAQGLRNTNAQADLADFVRDAYGRYEAFTPSQRYILSTYTPFAAWIANSVKFLTVTMPRDHPVMSSILLANSRAWEEWRENEGLTLLPGFLAGALPRGPEAVTNLARYTPFSLVGDPVENMAGALLPQVQPIYTALRHGLDWKGAPIGEHERGDDVPAGDRLAESFRSLASSMVPGVNPIKKAVKKGPLSLVNPFPAQKRQHPDITRAFNEIEAIEKAKEQIKKQHPKVSADEPTPRYARLHARERKANVRLHKVSKGEYGETYKEPYEHAPAGTGGTGGGGGGGGFWGDGGSTPTVRPKKEKQPAGGGGGGFWKD